MMLSNTIQLFPADWLVIIYLIMTSILIILFKHRAQHAMKHLMGRFFAMALIIVLAKAQAPFLQWLHIWYPLVTLAVFYWELGYLARLIFPEPLDDKVINWEARLFKCQPSLKFSERFANYYLSEFLHLSYLMYYLILIALPLQLYITHQTYALNFTIFAELTVFYACLLFYMAFPVAGPRYVFQKDASALSRGTLFQYTHNMLEKHSSKGTAFPSSHVAMASIVFFCALWFHSPIAYIIAPFWLGITIGVVYCRFHYALDAIAGILVAIILFGVLSQVMAVW